MLKKDTMAITDHWSIPINCRGVDIWFDLSMSLVQGRRSLNAFLHKMAEISLSYAK